MPLPIVNDAPVHKPAPSGIEQEQARVKHALQPIKHLIGVHSGKGGVGKTFVSCNLAMLLAAEGFETGLLDADVDCPNVPHFLNITAELEMDEHERITPLVHNGMKVVSTGFIEQGPLIIRGPVKHRVLLDFLERTFWGPLDYLIIDFPPGTSDVPLSAMQYANLTGVILVTTPQKEAVADVKRAAAMAQQLGVPILGLIENMSGEVFGTVGEALAAELSIPFIGSIPLSKSIREAADAGEQVFLSDDLEVFTKTLLRTIRAT